MIKFYSDLSLLYHSINIYYSIPVLKNTLNLKQHDNLRIILSCSYEISINISRYICVLSYKIVGKVIIILIVNIKIKFMKDISVIQNTLIKH